MKRRRGFKLGAAMQAAPDAGKPVDSTRHGRLRVAFVTTSFPLSAGSSSGPFIRQLVCHLPPTVEVDVITPCGRRPVHQPSSERYRVRCFRYAPWRWQTLAHTSGGLPAAVGRGGGAWLLLGLLVPAMFGACLRAAWSADLIHANWSVNGAIAGMAGLLTRTPVVTTLRGSDVRSAERSLAFRLLLKACYRFSERVVAVGQTIRERSARLLCVDASSIGVISNGVDQAFFSVPLPTVQGTLRLVSVGSLVEVKRIDMVLRALASLRDEVQWELTVVGEGPDGRALQALAQKMGVSERVHFSGTVPPSEIPCVLSRHQVFVLASRSEGRPNALIEALAAARAVVASQIPEIAEVVSEGRTGLLFCPDKEQELVDQLYRLYKHPDLIRRLGEAGRESVRGMDWRSTGARYGEMYAAAVRGQRPECAD